VCHRNGQIALVHITYTCCVLSQRCVEMEGKNFLKLCKDTKLMGKALTSTDIDLIFTKVGCSLSELLPGRRITRVSNIMPGMHPWLEA